MEIGDVVITKPYPTTVRGRVINKDLCDRVGTITGVHAHDPILFTVNLDGTEVALYEDELDGPYNKGDLIPADEALGLLKRIMGRSIV
jgi:hypothetical protein